MAVWVLERRGSLHLRVVGEHVDVGWRHGRTEQEQEGRVDALNGRAHEPEAGSSKQQPTGDLGGACPVRVVLLVAKLQLLRARCWNLPQPAPCAKGRNDAKEDLLLGKVRRAERGEDQPERHCVGVAGRAEPALGQRCTGVGRGRVS